MLPWSLGWSAVVPIFPRAQKRLLYYPTQLGPKLPEGSSQAFSWPPTSYSFLAPLWAGYFFLPKPEPVLCRKEDKTKDVPQIPIGGHTAPQSVLHLLPSSVLLGKPSEA